MPNPTKTKKKKFSSQSITVQIKRKPPDQTKPALRHQKQIIQRHNKIQITNNNHKKKDHLDLKLRSDPQHITTTQSALPQNRRQQTQHSKKNVNNRVSAYRQLKCVVIEQNDVSTEVKQQSLDSPLTCRERNF